MYIQEETPMQGRVQKWGNSLGLRIPKGLAENAKLHPGSPVELQVIGGKLVVTAIGQKKLTLRELLAKVTKKNLHGETFAGPRRGKEIIS
jgi:antitoxin MazE